MNAGSKVRATRRLACLAGLVLLWGVLIFCKLVWLQLIEHQQYLRLARAQQEIRVELPAPRGAMFDRTGKLLARSISLDSVSVNPRRVPDLPVASEILARILGLDRATLYGRMRWAFDRNLGFLWVKRKISASESERLRSLKLDWIEFESESQRQYPKGTLAAHLIGSVDHDERGNSGLELYEDKLLRGRPGDVFMLTDVKRRRISEREDKQALLGTPLALTIDERIQYATEVALAKAVQDSHGETGSAVVMNPYTGEILALASYPTFDPNKPPHPGEDKRARFNNAISVPFEPGSVFKIVTLSAGLETTDLTPESIINCGNGSITLFGRTVHEAHQGHGYGSIPMRLVLAKSSNVGAIQIGMKVGQENLYNYVRLFGFGQRTGIPLPAESSGIVRRLARWGKTSLGSVAMGHEVGVTTLQLAIAASVIANGGFRVKPRLILRQGDTPPPREPPERVLRAENAIKMRGMMEGVVLPGGTGTRARLAGYSSGGKTGSAMIYDFEARHYTHKYNASFVGFAPLTNPAIVVAVTVNKTHLFGGAASAPAFKVIAEEALRVLDVPKDLPDAPLEVARNETAEESDQAVTDLGVEGPTILAAEEAQEQDAQDAQEAPAAVPSRPDADLAGPKVPDFRGMSKRAVLETAVAQGLPLLLDGSGVARLQFPSAGSILRKGERIRVQFAK